jgi:hypothetical protein
MPGILLRLLSKLLSNNIDADVMVAPLMFWCESLPDSPNHCGTLAAADGGRSRVNVIVGLTSFAVAAGAARDALVGLAGEAGFSCHRAT